MGFIWVSCRASPTRIGFLYDSSYQSTLDAVYVYVVPWSEFPIVPSYPDYPQYGCVQALKVSVIGEAPFIDDVGQPRTSQKYEAVPRRARIEGS